jgi:hypothetical protein
MCLRERAVKKRREKKMTRVRRREVVERRRGVADVRGGSRLGATIARKRNAPLRANQGHPSRHTTGKNLVARSCSALQRARWGQSSFIPLLTSSYCGRHGLFSRQSPRCTFSSKSLTLKIQLYRRTTARPASGDVLGRHRFQLSTVDVYPAILHEDSWAGNTSALSSRIEIAQRDG